MLSLCLPTPQGLDPASRHSLWDVVKHAKQDRGIILTTHRWGAHTLKPFAACAWAPLLMPPSPPLGWLAWHSQGDSPSLLRLILAPVPLPSCYRSMEEAAVLCDRLGIL